MQLLLRAGRCCPAKGWRSLVCLTRFDRIRRGGIYGRRIVGLGGAGVVVVYDNGGITVPAGDGPYEGDDPADEGPAEKEIEEEDAAAVGAPADQGDDGRQEIGNEEDSGDPPGKDEG